MDMHMLLPKEHVVLHVAGSCRTEVLRVLIAPLLKDGIVLDEGAFLQALEERERQVTTWVGDGVAFPHARCASVRRLGLTVGIADPPGVPFGGDGAEPCRLLFLLAVPSTAPTAHLPLLTHLSQFVHQKGRVERLLAMGTRSPIVRAIVGSHDSHHR